MKSSSITRAIGLVVTSNSEFKICAASAYPSRLRSANQTSQSIRAANNPGCFASNSPKIRLAFSTLPSFSASSIFHSTS